MTITARGTHVSDVPPCEKSPWLPSPESTPNIDGKIALCRGLAARDPETGHPDWSITAECHPRSRYVAIGRFRAGGGKTPGVGVSMRCLIELLLWNYTGGGDALTSVAIDLPELITMQSLKTSKPILSRDEAVKAAENLCREYARNCPPSPEPSRLPEAARNLPDSLIAEGPL